MSDAVVEAVVGLEVRGAPVPLVLNVPPGSRLGQEVMGSGRIYADGAHDCFLCQISRNCMGGRAVHFQSHIYITTF